MGLETAAITSLLFGTKKFVETTEKPSKDVVTEGLAAASVFGHASNTVERLDKSVAKGNFSSAAAALAERAPSKAIEAAGAVSEVGKYLGSSINGLIICNAGYNVYKDEDKPKALTEQGLKVGGMFGAENLCKALQLTEKVEEMALPAKMKPIAAAATFVAASVSGAYGGDKLGKIITGRDKEAEIPQLKESLATA